MIGLTEEIGERLRQEYRYPRCEFSPCIPTT
nr:MAG TPA: hypothetical protein [Caudoviricetes sp.]